jgi:hypothetical protein
MSSAPGLPTAAFASSAENQNGDESSQSEQEMQEGTSVRESDLLRLTTVLLLLTASAAGADDGASALQENALLKRLLQEGVVLTDDVTVRLPAPEVPDGLAQGQQQAIVTRIADRYTWQQFVRPSAVAPFVLRQAYVKDSRDRRVGHTLDLWFVAYGTLADLRKQQTAEDLFAAAQSENSSPDNRLKELTADRLAPFQLEPMNPELERYVLVEASIMNRVYVRGVGHAERSQSSESLLIAWELETRFQSAAELASMWQPIESTQLGDRRRGDARPYRGLGGYVKVTSLAEPAGALLFEVHSVLHEPEDWFQGSNFLRSKTPLLVREQIDKLRRKLALRSE